MTTKNSPECKDSGTDAAAQKERIAQELSDAAGVEIEPEQVVFKDEDGDPDA